jgi:hypothetical protein
MLENGIGTKRKPEFAEIFAKKSIGLPMTRTNAASSPVFSFCSAVGLSYSTCSTWMPSR